MKNDRSKDQVELLGEYLRDRKTSSEEERVVLDHVWQRMSSELDSKAVQRRAPQRPFITRFGWTGAIAAVVIATAFIGAFTRNAAPALVESAEGSFERIDEKGSLSVRTGEKVAFGELVRTGGQARAVLMLKDGSKIEMRPNSELAVEKADDGVRIRLKGGSVFVTAAKQRAGHLYVQTKDVTVSVVGTVFLVNAEEAGSRVAVIEGEVHVRQGDKTSRLLPGQQVASNPLMAEHPVVEQLAWSRSAEPYLAPLQQPKRLEFEVAVLRPVPANGRFIARLRCKGIDGEFRPVGPNAPPVPLGRCVSDAAVLQMILATAYDVQDDPQDTRISGLPPLNEQPVFQVEAKAEDPAWTTRAELRQMLQNMLVDKLKLKVHRETREMEGYVLTVGKDGVKFKETSGDEEVPRWLPNGDPRLDINGQVLPTIYEGKSRMNLFVNSLSSVARMPVVDKTGLPALYDIRFVIDLLLPPPPAGGGPRGGGGPNAGPPPPQQFDPPLPKALEDQLGLHLERGKVPVEYLVVDHFEKPSEN